MCHKNISSGKGFLKHIKTHPDAENIKAVSHFASQIHTSYFLSKNICQFWPLRLATGPEGVVNVEVSLIELWGVSVIAYCILTLSL